MKRASGANSNQGDFKRLKAKVGKRAPKRLNETDTKFKSATVQVQSQSISNEKAVTQQGLLVSSRGINFSQLMAQLNHHAANARSSAVQGIKDVIKHTPANVIPQHLALIIPSLSKCLVDEDSDIRKLAMSILFEDVTPKLASCNMAGSMKPFLQLILAYIGSALHSLDQDVRYDGCKALELSCSTYQDLFLDGGDEITKLQTAIPAFTILLDDVSGGLASMSRRGVDLLGTEEKKKDASKNRQRQSKNAQRGVGVLKAFLSVNRITTMFQHGYDVLGEGLDINLTTKKSELVSLPSTSKPDLEFLPGGRSSNAIVWSKNQTRYAAKVSSISSIQGEDRDNGKNQVSSKLDVAVQRTLFAKLRDRLVEISQRGQSGEHGIYLSPTDAQECSLVVRSIRILWNGYCRGTLLNGRKNNKVADDSNYVVLKSTASGVLSLLLECFAVKDASGKSDHCQIYDSLNASVCLALSELGSVLDKFLSSHDTNIESEWVQAIFSYVIPQLDGEFTNESTTALTASSTTRFTLITVIEQLLVQPEIGNCTSLLNSTRKLDDKKSKELVTRFGNRYFTPDGFDETICRNQEGRKAVELLISLIKIHLSNIEMREGLMHMALVLPKYLIQWRGSFPMDTAVVLSTLLALARNCEAEGDEEIRPFCDSLRLSLESLFVTTSKNRKIGSAKSKMKAKVSVFDELSQTSQTLLLSLLGILKHPSDELMTSLAQICSRRYSFLTKERLTSQSLVLNDTMIDYLSGVVHSMSRTITLQQYLTFLVNSCGIHSAKYSTASTEEEENGMINSNIFEFVCSYDKAIARTCRYFLLTKSKNTFNMLLPVLQSWLKSSRGDDELPLKVLKIRAALAIISCHALSCESRNLSVILETDDMKTSLVHAIYTLLLVTPISSGNEDEAVLKQIKTRTITPAMVSFGSAGCSLTSSLYLIISILFVKKVLLEQSSLIFVEVLNFVTITIISDKSATTEKEHLLRWLVLVVKSKSLIPVIRAEKNVAEKLRQSSELIDKNSGPLHAASGIFAMQVNILLGFNQA